MIWRCNLQMAMALGRRRLLEGKDDDSGLSTKGIIIIVGVLVIAIIIGCGLRALCECKEDRVGPRRGRNALKYKDGHVVNAAVRCPAHMPVCHGSMCAIVAWSTCACALGAVLCPECPVSRLPHLPGQQHTAAAPCMLQPEPGVCAALYVCGIPCVRQRLPARGRRTPPGESGRCRRCRHSSHSSHSSHGWLTHESGVLTTRMCR
jgi:hypothetical protein